FLGEVIPWGMARHNPIYSVFPFRKEEYPFFKQGKNRLLFFNCKKGRARAIAHAIDISGDY
ncbi:MAG TPA: hypothetical protein VE134_06965, partial [Methanomicrobiales archaeon]|nr:hypothetical protein [Methanomicrobiales archaeon]